MIVNVYRSSAAMGDDVLTHSEAVELPVSSTLAETAAYLRQRRSLAQIERGKATWLL